MTLDEAVRRLRDGGVREPEHDARELFRHFGGIPRHELVLKNTEVDSAALSAAVARRSRGEPLQYIIGETGFYRETYEVNADCLIPREDTEILVDYAVKALHAGESFVDLCTGSGCIAVSVLANTTGTRATAVDISPAALAVAKRNAERNRVAERIDIVCGDAMSYRPKTEVYAVLANPPYVTEAEYSELERELYHEPRLALVGGDDGLDFYRAITPNCAPRIKSGGFIAFEIGAAQADAISTVARSAGMSCEIIKDLSGHDRVAVLRREGEKTKDKYQ